MWMHSWIAMEKFQSEKYKNTQNTVTLMISNRILFCLCKSVIFSSKGNSRFMAFAIAYLEGKKAKHCWAGQKKHTHTKKPSHRMCSFFGWSLRPQQCDKVLIIQQRMVLVVCQFWFLGFCLFLLVSEFALSFSLLSLLFHSGAFALAHLSM